MISDTFTKTYERLKYKLFMLLNNRYLKGNIDPDIACLVGIEGINFKVSLYKIINSIISHFAKEICFEVPYLLFSVNINLVL